LEYNVTIYKRVKCLTIPVRKQGLLLLISTERYCDHEKILSEKVLPMIARLQ
jgi:hypothetical protein